MKNTVSVVVVLASLLFAGCQPEPNIPTGVNFQKESLVRQGAHGDNWCITWMPDGSQLTSMDDGNWLLGPERFHNHLYRISGDPDGFTRDDIPAYPHFTQALGGWFGYGVLSVENKLYSMVSRTPGDDWSGPFRGVKMLTSSDQGESWYRVNANGEKRLVAPEDSLAMEALGNEDMFFFEEEGKQVHGKTAYPFSFCSFVQNGRANSAAPDDYIYVYSPEGAQSNQLLLARVKKDRLEYREDWEYFNSWKGDKAIWTSQLDQRGSVHVFPEKNSAGEYFGWYSWLPSVVWNKGLGLYIMVNGGSYGGHGMTDSGEDYYHSWMHTKTGSLGFWYAEKPYGPWKQFFYEEYWTVDDDKNRTYQPKLSPKWISEDGRKMVLIWSDAMKNEEGRSHLINYKWNQMNIELEF